jgi:hypothetical protein
MMPNQALRRTRPSRRGCNRCVPCAGSLWRALPIILLCLCSCRRGGDYLMTRGPGGFCTEDMSISLQSIPHQRVQYFNGVVLVLALSTNDCQALLTDSRFQWRQPPGKSETKMRLGEWEFIDGDRYDVVVCELNTGRLFGLDKTRLVLAMCSDQAAFFK